MKATTNPTWLRIADVTVGFITLLAGMWVVFDLSMLQVTAFYALAGSLLLVGILRLLRTTRKETKKEVRIMNFLSGIAALGLSLVVVLLYMYQAVLLFQLVGTGLLIVGIARVGAGFLDDNLPTWARVSLAITGLFIVVVTSLALLLPGIDVVVSILLISVAFIANGILRLIWGAQGKL